MFEWNETIRGEAQTLPTIARVVAHYVEPGTDYRSREERLIELVGELAEILLPGQQDRFVEALGYRRVVPAPPERKTWFDQNPVKRDHVADLNYILHGMRRAQVIYACRFCAVTTMEDLLNYWVGVQEQLDTIPMEGVQPNDIGWIQAAFTADSIALGAVLRLRMTPERVDKECPLQKSITYLGEAWACSNVAS